MRPLREQQFIVHLDIRATALNRSEAVQAALRQVRLGSLGDVVCSVEAAEMSAAVPAQHPSSGGAPQGKRGDRRHEMHNRYPNEFLG